MQIYYLISIASSFSIQKMNKYNIELIWKFIFVELACEIVFHQTEHFYWNLLQRFLFSFFQELIEKFIVISLFKLVETKFIGIFY